MLPPAARSHYQRLQAIQALTVKGARRIWRQMRPTGNWQQQYDQNIGSQLVLLASAAQLAAARDADTYVAEVLNELGFGPATQSGVVAAESFVGWSGDGRPVESLFDGALVTAGRSMQRQRSEAVEAASQFREADAPSEVQALADAERWIEEIARTLISDTARAAQSAAIAPRDWVEGYVRMLNPPSCSRCAVLAGRFYLWNDGFERHPLCDCIHIPASESDWRDLRVSPSGYFGSLSTSEQDRYFTKSGAQAIRDGADIGQVVNARRGMSTAQQNIRGWIPKGRLERVEAFGRGVFTTTEGVTRHGQGRKAMGTGRPVRLMPESIYEIANGDRAEAIRLLQLYGFIL